MVFEMGKDAGELPRKFISFHCLVNESIEMRESNTEGTVNYPGLPQRNDSEIVAIEETETSPTENLAVFQVTGVEKSTVREGGDTNEDRVKIGSQECLLSSSDEGNEGLEKFLRDKLDSLSCQFVEV